MRTTNNKNIQGQIEKMLYQKGFHTVLRWYDRIDSLGSVIMLYVPIAIVLIRLFVSIYYYPRSLQYFIKHPLTESAYFLSSLGVYFYIALGVFFGSALLAVVIRWILLKIASHIYYQVYGELGVEAPAFEK